MQQSHLNKPANAFCAGLAIPRVLIKSSYLINRQCYDQRLVVALANDPPLCHGGDISLLHQPDDHISSVQKDACSPGTDVITWLCTELDRCITAYKKSPENKLQTPYNTGIVLLLVV